MLVSRPSKLTDPDLHAPQCRPSGGSGGWLFDVCGPRSTWYPASGQLDSTGVIVPHASYTSYRSKLRALAGACCYSPRAACKLPGSSCQLRQSSARPSGPRSLGLKRSCSSPACVDLVPASSLDLLRSGVSSICGPGTESQSSYFLHLARLQQFLYAASLSGAELLLV